MCPPHTVSGEKPRAGRARGGEGSFPAQQAGSRRQQEGQQSCVVPSRQTELTGEAGLGPESCPSLFSAPEGHPGVRWRSWRVKGWARW